MGFEKRSLQAKIVRQDSMEEVTEPCLQGRDMERREMEVQLGWQKRMGKDSEDHL